MGGAYGSLSRRSATTAGVYVHSERRVALIGAGVGIAPLRALAEGLDYNPGDAVLLHRFTDRPLFEHELLTLARERGLELLWLPGSRRSPDSWLGKGSGLVDDLSALTFWVPDIADRDVYVCGPVAWTDTVRRVTEAAGVPPEQFHVESFRW